MDEPDRSLTTRAGRREWLAYRVGEHFHFFNETGVEHPQNNGFSLSMISFILGNAVDDGLMSRSDAIKAGEDLLEQVTTSLNGAESAIRRAMGG